MILKLKPCTVLKLIRDYGRTGEQWEKAFSEFLNIPVELPLFFWEIEIVLHAGRMPERLTLETPLEKSWMSIFYRYNFRSALEKSANRELLFRYHLYLPDSNSREGENSDRIPCELLSRSDEFAEKESAQ